MIFSRVKALYLDFAACLLRSAGCFKYFWHAHSLRIEILFLWFWSWPAGVNQIKISDAPGPGCSKLTTSLVNVSLKFQPLISQICLIFVEKMWEASLIFSTKNTSVFGYKVVKYLTTWPLNKLVKLTMLWTTGPCFLKSEHNIKFTWLLANQGISAVSWLL